MKNIILFFIVAALITCTSDDKNGNNSNSVSHDNKFFEGAWTYRSMFNDTAWQDDFDSLAFAAAIMDLKLVGKDSVTGLIHWETAPPVQGLKISGRIYYNDSVACYSLVGIGDSTLGTPGWQYDYQGYAVPKWSFGVNQATVIVGSVARAKPHSGEPAGVVASTYMVKRN